MKLSKLRVFVRRTRATLGGYFWLPCPICGEYFGGFEHGNGSVLQPNGTRKVCCKGCDYEAGKINGINGTDLYLSPAATGFLLTRNI